MLHYFVLHLMHFLSAGASLAATAAVSFGDTGATAGLIDSGGGGGDTGSSDGGDTGGDPGLEAEVAEGAEGQDGQEGQEGTEQQSKPATESKIDWRTVPAQVKSHIQQLAKTDPKTANMIQNAVYTSQSMLKEFPGGLKEVKALKASIDEVGGLEEVKTLQTTHRQVVEDQEKLDTAARNGDPQVLDNLVQIAGEEGFGKLMPTAIDKWAAKDPLGYSHVMSKIMVNSLREGGVVSQLNMAFKMLGLKNEAATAEAMNCLQEVANWANKLNETAVKAPERPQIDPKIQDQQKAIDQQKTQLFNNEFSTSFGAWRNNQIKERVSQISNGRQLNDYQMKTLGERIINDVREILTSDPDYVKTLNRHHGARDMAELQKFTRSRTSKILPEVARKAYKSLFSNPTAQKTAVKTAVKTATTTKTGTAAVAPVAGWAKVSADKAPTPDQIDSKKTTFEMKFKKQAILKNGTKVYWGNNAPA